MDKRWKPSVTVAAIIEKQGKFLLIEEETTDGIRLNTPAGHLDQGESPAQGCAREAMEETAHPFTPTALVGVYIARFQRPDRDEDVTYIRFAFCGEVGEEIKGQALDVGILRTLWMTADEVRASVPRHRSPLVLQSIEDYLSGRRLPMEAIYTDPSVFDPS